MSTNSNVTSGFIDLATFDELEKYAYGGPDATAYFVRETRKSTWFTIVPVVLSKANGQSGFNQDWSVQISRAGDYLLATWLRVNFPQINMSTTTVTPVTATSAAYVAGGFGIRWTRNLMHNLVSLCTITFNDLVAAQFDNYHLDFWAAFTTPAGKQNGYNNMILNFDAVNGGATGVGASNGVIPAFTGNLPLPFFFSRDSGVALPTAALPYNDMRINFQFRNWDQLLIVDLPSGAWTADGTTNYSRVATTADLASGTAPVLGQCQVWANYAIVSNDERKRMACAPRNIWIEQEQTAPLQTFVPNQNPTPSYDIRFSHAIKVFFFGVRNTTVASEWSNYTCAEPYPSGNANAVVQFNPSAALDPISQFTLVYENTQRLSAMGVDYFSLVNPWYHAPVIPQETGYHTYSYSLDFICLDPKGSTNYGKLTNVSVSPVASAMAIACNQTAANWNSAAGGVVTAGGTIFATASAKQMAGVPVPQTYSYVHTAVNNNIIRVEKFCLVF